MKFSIVKLRVSKYGEVREGYAVKRTTWFGFVTHYIDRDCRNLGSKVGYIFSYCLCDSLARAEEVLRVYKLNHSKPSMKEIKVSEVERALE